MAGVGRWGPNAFAAIKGEHVDVLFDPPRQPIWREAEGNPAADQ
jgi:hypothetical protein